MLKKRQYITNDRLTNNKNGKVMARKDSKNYKEILYNFLGGGSRWNTKLLCVHHINHNHDDNDERNLLLMPLKMHSRYHYLYSVALESCLFQRNLDFNFSWQRPMLEEFIAIKDDMCSLCNAQWQVHNMSLNSKITGEQIDGVGFLLKVISRICYKYI